MDTPPEQRLAAALAPFAGKEETVFIFDWDDTILPTSWLERVQALNGNGQLRPKLQQAMTSLCEVAARTLDLAAGLGSVIIITNSVPGWVDQSCRHFMPSMHDRMRGFPIFARPMHAALTFKNAAFQRECRNYRNVVSVGDGEAERAASLRLQGPFPMRKAAPGSGDEPSVQRSIKSVKLIELPTCQQLIEQHEMLLQRLTDVNAWQGSLDLRAQFCGNNRSPAVNGKAASCTLVHFPTRNQRQPMRFTTTNSQSQLPPLARGPGGLAEEVQTSPWRPRSESDASSWRSRSESDGALTTDQQRLSVGGTRTNGDRWPPGPLELGDEVSTPPRTSSTAPVLAGLEARERARIGTPSRAGSAADAVRGFRGGPGSPGSTKMPQSLLARGQLMGARGGAAALREHSAPAGVRGC